MLRASFARLSRSRTTLLGGLMVGLVLLLALLAPVLPLADPEARDFSQRLTPPSSQHWLGTDSFGRDNLARVIWGSRVSVQVGLWSVLVAAGIGILLGAIAASLGGWVDALVMRTVDVFLAFPPILLALTVVAALGPSASSVIIALGLVYWTTYARVVRSSLLAIREEEYVEASRALGNHWWRILYRHMLPNAVGPLIVVASVGMGNAITAEAGLTFLGLGVQPPTPSWGGILNNGLQFLRQSPFVSASAGLAIMFTVLGFNLLGDGLRDLNDPRRLR